LSGICWYVYTGFWLSYSLQFLEFDTSHRPIWSSRLGFASDNLEILVIFKDSSCSHLQRMFGDKPKKDFVPNFGAFGVLSGIYLMHLSVHDPRDGIGVLRRNSRLDSQIHGKIITI
jgi:hypothetical protein